VNVGKHRAPSTPSAAHPRLRKVTAFFAILVLIATAVGGGAVYAINGLGKNITSVDTTALNKAPRPSTVVQTDTSATNLLIMGSDSRAGTNGAYGKAGGARSDTTLLVHIYQGRKSAVIVSIPRDSFVQLAGCTKTGGGTTIPYMSKFNAAFSVGGPICTIKTMEKLTNIRINNFVVVDFAAFKTVVDALGGVKVCLTSPAYDPVIPGRGGSGLNLPAGYSTIDGEQALAFVRARESLGDGSDLSRIKRQQEFVASMISGMTDKGLITNPSMMYRVLNAITSSLTTNSEFASIQALQNFALSLANLKPANITFVTTPYSMVGSGNVGWTTEAEKMWKALQKGQPWPPGSAVPSVSPTASTSVPVSGTPMPGASSSASATPSLSPGTTTAAVYACTKGNGKTKSK